MFNLREFMIMSKINKEVTDFLQAQPNVDEDLVASVLKHLRNVLEDKE